MWIDVTWGAGGSTAEKTMEICTNAHKFHGLDVMMHLTCTNMPIQSYEGFRKMTTLCKTKVPQEMSDGLEPCKDDDKKVKDYGVKVGVEMCQELLKNGVPGLHFYTLNLESAVMRIIDGLQLRPEHVSTRKLPWKQSAEDKRQNTEQVRPIFWANRPASYIKRTKVWDDFPNGRFGARASPAYGDITEVFVSYSKDSFAKVKQERLNM